MTLNWFDLKRPLNENKGFVLRLQWQIIKIYNYYMQNGIVDDFMAK